jgi:signal transduction histidine kinase
MATEPTRPPDLPLAPPGCPVEPLQPRPAAPRFVLSRPGVGRLSSAPRSGLTWPLDRAVRGAPGAGLGAGSDQPPTGTPCPALVVDDDPAVRLLIERALRRAGLAVHAVGTLAEARAAVRHGPFSAVVLDVALPHGDGIAFLRELVAADVGPVVMVTGADAASAAAEALRAGAADCGVGSGEVAVALPAVLDRALRDRQLAATARAARARIEALVALNELKSDFLARTSHELRTPLTLVLGYAELLRERDFTREQVREFASEILGEARHLAGLIDALLEMAGHRRAAGLPERLAVPIEPLAREVWALEGAAAQASHVLELDLEPGVSACADPTQLRRLLRALIANALSYSPAGGPITVAAARREGRLTLSVTDQGIGFDRAAGARLFEPLFRVESDHTHAVRGLGLGLATTRTIVEAHGGSIAAHSDGPGRGARFELWLPDGPDCPPSGRSAPSSG